MTIGMMYADFSDNPLSVKIENAVKEYIQKFPDKPRPNHCHIHPDADVDKKMPGIKIVRDATTVFSTNHLWIGVKE